MKRSATLLATAVVFSCSSTWVMASPIITIDFEGTITTVGASVSGAGVTVGAPVTGQFTYDLSAVDTIPDVNYGSYQAESFSIAFGGTFSASGTSTSVNTQNDQQNGSSTLPADGLTVLAWPAVGDSLNGRSVEGFQFGLRKENVAGDLWFDDHLPDLGDWAGVSLADINAADWHWMQFEQNSDTSIFDSQIRWNITSFSVTSVPEPATLLLLCCGLAGPFFLRKKRRG